MKASKTDAFTLIELLVVISIIAILAGIALPVFGQVQIKGAQTKALSNAKQIGTALRLYATENNGQYPSYTLGSNGKPSSPPVIVGSSNAAFAQLIPDYVPNEEIARRRANWKQPAPRYPRGYGALYSEHIGQADEGCDLARLGDLGAQF